MAPTEPPAPAGPSVAPAALIVTVPVNVRSAPVPSIVNVPKVSVGAVIVRRPPRLTSPSVAGVVGIVPSSRLAIAVSSESATGESANALKCGSSATTVPVATSYADSTATGPLAGSR